MVEIILSIATLILALIGLTSTIRYLALMIVSPQKSRKQAYLILLNDENAEFELRSALERAKWDNVFYSSPILAVEYKLDEETSEICRKIAEEYSNVIVCEPQDVLEYLI